MRQNISRAAQRLCYCSSLAFAFAILVIPIRAQDSAAHPKAGEHSLQDAVINLQEQLAELKSAVAEIRSESAQYRAESAELRRELSATQDKLAVQSKSPEPVAASPVRDDAEKDSSAAKSDRMSRLEEQFDLLSGKLNEQYQTKVESASKYRLRLSGIVLMNVFGNDGGADTLAFPSVASNRPVGSGAVSVGGTIQQTQLGFTVFGPDLLGARTRADLQTDFAAGYSKQGGGLAAGIFRLRTGTVRLDWENTSIVAGQDSLFFSPTTPTSFASLAVPALSYAGNLWNWTPQIRVEHRFRLNDDSQILLQGGILDPVSLAYSVQSPSFYPQAGQSSGVPAFAERSAYVSKIFGEPVTIGVAGYYERQSYGYGRDVDAWAAMSDWSLPLPKRFSLSGKFYRGRAIGGLDGGAGRSVLFNGPWPAAGTAIRPLNTVGGWSQLKYRASSTLEVNAAFGQESSIAADVRAFTYPTAYDVNPGFLRNRGFFLNTIWRPRSDLVFSAEYRHLGSATLSQYPNTLGHLNLSAGVLF